MKIGIDIDGTITAAPPLFSVLTRALRKEGHEVVIVTFRDKGHRKETEEELETLGVEYDKLVMGNQIANFPWKAKQVMKYDLDAFFEDSAEVIEEIKKVKPHCKTFHVRGWF
jgi:uncharacterized HAD superfamily protein